MTKKKLFGAFVAAVMVVGFIIATAGPAFAKPPKGADTSTPCRKSYWACIESCKGPFAPGRNQSQCTLKCDLKLLGCSDTKAPKAAEATTSTTEPPKQPGKNTGVLNPVNVGVKQPSSSGMNSQPKGKVNLDTMNVGGVKQLGGGSGSPSTSEGGTTMQRSGRNKKH